jgi:hypothetical protein
MVVLEHLQKLLQEQTLMSQQELVAMLLEHGASASAEMRLPQQVPQAQHLQQPQVTAA